MLFPSSTVFENCFGNHFIEVSEELVKSASRCGKRDLLFGFISCTVECFLIGSHPTSFNPFHFAVDLSIYYLLCALNILF